MQYRHTARCAFCEYEGTLTDEHIWPDWLARSAGLPLAMINTHHHHLSTLPVFGLNGFNAWGISRTRKSGDPGSEKLRIACAGCNNKWMSNLQVQAQPLIKVILRGGWPELNENSAKILARWCIMTVMVYEFKDIRSIAIPFAERQNLKHDTPLGSEWTVWIGSCSEELPNRRAAHRAYWISDGASIPDEPSVQVTTLHIGNMLAQVMYSLEDLSMYTESYSYRHKMLPLHPPVFGFNDGPPPAGESPLIEVYQHNLTEHFENCFQSISRFRNWAKDI